MNSFRWFLVAVVADLFASVLATVLWSILERKLSTKEA